ncbi:hypothetical protein LshimejAT787_1801030 [Lyophyllum shimeji]|uniref:Choline/carnitine acyltransferase domain-containing protein n=1 Tax=Lyophyllum shimeji TaxID=47721 RepID=A0A9P3Q012_LYOSH|nr:hypothetical protein LshimejAT787_1801030 [Lyophyllum shimeji]
MPPSPRSSPKSGTLLPATEVITPVRRLTTDPPVRVSFPVMMTPRDAPLRTLLLHGAAKASPADSHPAHAFRSFLLSRRDALFQCMALPSVLCTQSGGDQLTIAARVLHGVASIAAAPHDHLSVSATGQALDQEETDMFLETSRRVGLETDELVSSPGARHAVVWCEGHAFKLDVLNSAGVPVGERAIEAGLREIKTMATMRRTLTSVSVAWLSWNLARSEWLEARRMIEATGTNRKAFEVLDTALVTLALEGFEAPVDPAERLEAVRDGRGSVNRYADQVVGLVVFEDGVPGLVVDHAPVDGGIVNLFGNLVGTFHSSEEGGKRLQPVPLDLVIPSDLSFSIPAAPFTRAVRIANIARGLPQEIIDPIYTARLVPFMIHMAVQAAIRGTPSISMLSPFFVQPCSMRHFLKGRSDPTYPISSASFALVDALNSSDLGAVADARTFTTLFKQALRAHKTIIKAAKRGSGIGRHLAVLRYVIDQVAGSPAQERCDSAIPDAHLLRPLVEGWARFDQYKGPIVYVTGFDSSSGAGVKHGMGNLYTDDQLSCWYNLSADAHSNNMVVISLTLAGSGVFAREGTLDRLLDRISRAFATMARRVLLPHILNPR